MIEVIAGQANDERAIAEKATDAMVNPGIVAYQQAVVDNLDWSNPSAQDPLFHQVSERAYQYRNARIGIKPWV